MVTASFSIHNLEFFLLILVRVSTMLYAAPFFNTKGVPSKAKIGLAFFLSLILVADNSYYDLQYNTVFGYTMLIIKEAITGLLLGFSANVAMMVLSLAGQIIDVEIGFSMVQIFDPMTNQQTSIFGTYYNYLVMLVMLLSNMHYFVITALMDSFQLIPLGGIQIHPDLMLDSAVQMLTQYFILGFRVALPVFSASLLLNIVLGILAKTAPQMNMFVVGLQLKIVVGLVVVFVTVVCIPNIADMLFDSMQSMVKWVMKAISAG